MKLPVYLISIFFLIVACGCAKVANLNQLLTLKHLSDEQKNVGKDVEHKNADFDILLAMVKSGEISHFKDKKSIATRFGVPILSRERLEAGINIEEWIYRYQTDFFGSPKVYLQFNQEGQLIKSFAVDEKLSVIASEAKQSQ